MSPAPWPRDVPHDQRLLHIDAEGGTFTDHRTSDLPRLLCAGDLLVFNDAATLPASLPAFTEDGAPAEIRLAGHVGERFTALVLGAGDWRTPTERRPRAPALREGQRLTLGTPCDPHAPAVHVVRIIGDSSPSRLVEIVFDRSGAELYDLIYRHGRPVQYAYVARPLAVWHVQNAFASRPWSFEAPSAALGLDWDVLFALRNRGVQWAPLTHSAGLSSTGSTKLDARLPLPERYDIPIATVSAIERVRARGGRVIAVGTTVVRALESAAEHGTPLGGDGVAALRVGPTTVLRVVDAVLSGMHEEGSSHFSLLQAFATIGLLRRSSRHAARAGYLQHEFGDACLVTARRAGDAGGVASSRRITAWG